MKVGFYACVKQGTRPPLVLARWSSLGLALALSIGSVTASSIYSYTDERGNTVFTDEPRDGATPVTVDPPPPIPLRQLDLPTPTPITSPEPPASPADAAPAAPPPNSLPQPPVAQPQPTEVEPITPPQPDKGEVERIEHEHGGWTETTTRPPRTQATPAQITPPDADIAPVEPIAPITPPQPENQEVERIEHEHGGWTETTTRPPSGQSDSVVPAHDPTEPAVDMTQAQPPTGHYETFVIARPAEKSVVLGAGGTLHVALALDPELDRGAGDRIEVLVDGVKRIQGSTGLRHLISGIAAGEHQIRARIVRDDEVIHQTPLHLFTAEKPQ